MWLLKSVPWAGKRVILGKVAGCVGGPALPLPATTPGTPWHRLYHDPQLLDFPVLTSTTLNFTSSTWNYTMEGIHRGIGTTGSNLLSLCLQWG